LLSDDWTGWHLSALRMALMLHGMGANLNGYQTLRVVKICKASYF
jgi:hypothetical protein